jgi:hypothetical protein
VRTLERMSRLLLVVKGKVLSQDVPTVGDVTDSTVAGKCLVRHEGSPPAAPSLPRGVQPTIDQSHCRHHSEQSAQKYSGTSVVLPHHVHRDNPGIRSKRVRRPHPSVLSYRIPRDFYVNK